MKRIRLIDAIRAQEEYSRTKKPRAAALPPDTPARPQKLADHLIVKVLIESYKGRKATSIAKSLNLKPITVYNVMRRYLFVRRENGDHTYKRNPDAD